MKVGNLVRWKGLDFNTRLGVIVGFDDENDPKVRDCKSGVIIAHWRASLEVLNESR